MCTELIVLFDTDAGAGAGTHQTHSIDPLSAEQEERNESRAADTVYNARARTHICMYMCIYTCVCVTLVCVRERFYFRRLQCNTFGVCGHNLKTALGFNCKTACVET